MDVGSNVGQSGTGRGSLTTLTGYMRKRSKIRTVVGRELEASPGGEERMFRWLQIHAMVTRGAGRHRRELPA